MNVMLTLFSVGSVSFCFVCFQMTPTANRRQEHARTPCTWRSSCRRGIQSLHYHSNKKYSVKLVKVTSNIVTKGGPNIQHNYVGRAVGDERSTLTNHLVSKDGKRRT